MGQVVRFSGKSATLRGQPYLKRVGILGRGKVSRSAAISVLSVAEAIMGDLADGEHTQVNGSGSAVYTLKNSGGVYSCTCPAWMHQSLGIEVRTCKHLRAFRGDAAEQERVGSA